MAVSATNTDASARSGTSTLTSVPIGTAFTGRVVVAYVESDVGSYTIGGVAATATSVDTYGGRWIAAVVSTGTTATIAASGASFIFSYGVWSLSGDPSTTAAAVFDTAGSFSGSIAASDDSSVLGVVGDGGAGSPSWTSGLTNNGAVITDGFGSQWRDASVDIATAQTVNFTVTGSDPANIFILTAVNYAGSGGGGAVVVAKGSTMPMMGV